MKKIGTTMYNKRERGYYNDHGKEGTSPYDKTRKEFGKLEGIPQETLKHNMALLYIYLRDFAGGRMSLKDFQSSLLNFLDNQENVKAFLKFLHMNGFNITIKI